MKSGKLYRVFKSFIIAITISNLISCNYFHKTTDELLKEKGGATLTLEVPVATILRAMVTIKDDTLFNAAIEKAETQKKNPNSDFLTLFANVLDEATTKDFQLSHLFLSPDYPEINYQTTNSEMFEILKRNIEDIVNATFQVLASRIEYLTEIDQPDIRRVGPTCIIVQLPGFVNLPRIRKMLTEDGNLGFWETYDNTEVFEYLAKINNELKIIDSIEHRSNIKANIVEIKKEKQNTQANENVLSLIEKVEQGKLENSDNEDDLTRFTRENPLFATLRPNVSSNGQLIKGTPTVGISKLSDTSIVNSYFEQNHLKQMLPRDLKLLWEYKPFDEKGEFVQLVALKVTQRDERPILTGETITLAKAEYGQYGTAEVTIKMNAEGNALWERITGSNIGKQIAIVFDNHVYSFPTVNSEIKGGRSTISGSFTIEEAMDFAAILNSGRLPVKIKIVNEEIISPSQN